MGSVERRLRRLEAASLGRPQDSLPPALGRYFGELENVHRAQAGLEPPEIPYTKEDHRDDLEMIRQMRQDPGWQTPGAQARLDEFEREAREWIARSQA